MLRRGLKFDIFYILHVLKFIFYLFFDTFYNKFAKIKTKTIKDKNGRAK